MSRDVRYTLALILAGGRGTRLQGLTKWRVKPAVPFGGRFRIIDFTLSNCINSGIRKIGVLTQYKSHSLIRHIVHGWGLLHAELGEFIEILPAQQRIAEKWYSGTADAVYQNLDILRHYNPEYLLILAGDHIYKMDYGPLIAYHRSHHASLTVSCIEVPLADAGRFGVLAVDDEQRVLRFDEKPDDPLPIPGRPDVALASMGVYVFDASYLYDRLIRDADDPHSNHDFGRDIVPRLIDEGERVMAYPFRDVGTGVQAYWRDVGTVDSYWQANMELVEVTPELNLYDEVWPIRSRSRQLPPAKFVFNDEGRRGMAVDSLVASGCVISGAYVERSLISSQGRIEEGSAVRESVLLPGVVVRPRCRIRRAVIDKGCVVPEGTSIGVDAQSDRDRFYVSPGGVVLVTPDMLGQHFHRIR